jgi:starch synthase (maltosyl-transferring)
MDSSLPRVVIEDVRPAVDAGRYPIKRVLGTAVHVSAAIFKDGHDLIAARLLVKSPDKSAAASWDAIPLQYRFDPDRWYATFTAQTLGRWQYTIEAWPDAYGSWQSDLRKRVAAGQDVATELIEGAALLERAARRARGAAKRQLVAAAAVLGGASDTPIQERIERALDASLLPLIDFPLEEAARTRAEVFELIVDREAAAFSAWYEMFPRSQTDDPARHGTFADASERLPDLAELGFDVVYLPPIHPIGRTHRKGPNNSRSSRPGDVGSPWAIGADEGGHTAVHPDLGSVTDFEAFVKRANELGMEVALDFALQCSPDHPWVAEHPEWFFRRPDGSIHYAENPPKKYEDIYPLNFWCEDRVSLWEACRDVLLFWIDCGVKIFRVDNPHTKPFAFWEWCLADVQARHPDTVFLAEAFTRPNRMKALAKLGFNQSYTYFTWKNSKWELRELMTDLLAGEMAEYYRPNFFANTPDILHEYLQSGGRSAFRIRLLLAATLSPIYGIYSGFELCESTAVHEGSEEYQDSEKYQIRVRDWHAPGNIRDDIRLLNQLRRKHLALRQLINLEVLHVANENVFCFRKWADGEELLCIVNLDPHRPQETMVSVPVEKLGLPAETPYVVEDLLSGDRYTWQGRDNYVRLDPAARVAHLLRLPAATRAVA